MIEAFEGAAELLAVDEALTALATIEMRFFGGLSVAETAAALKVSDDTVLRDWRLARAWLLVELSPK